jgi:hypothetical protein
MSLHPDTKDATPNQHESNKVIREYLAWAHYRLQQVPMIIEEHKMLAGTLDVLAAFCKDLQAKIEAVEPIVKEEAEKKAPYIMEAAPLKEVQ